MNLLSTFLLLLSISYANCKNVKVYRLIRQVVAAPQNEYGPPGYSPGPLLEPSNFNSSGYGPSDHTPGNPLKLFDEASEPQFQYGPPGHTPGNILGASDISIKISDCPPNSPAKNKMSVIAFYEELFGKKNFAALDTYIGLMYIQHNPMTLDGKDKLLETLNGPFWSKLTGYKIHRIIAEDDFVWVQDRMDFGPKSYVFLDILRFECGKIVEHWDVIQEITGKEINPKAFF